GRDRKHRPSAQPRERCLMSAGATLEVPSGHPAFAGHFPNFPVLPGAALLDETLWILCSERGLELEDWQVAAVKFSSAVRPADLLSVDHESAGRQIRFIIRSAERRVASGSLAPRERGAAATPGDAAT